MNEKRDVNEVTAFEVDSQPGDGTRYRYTSFRKEEFNGYHWRFVGDVEGFRYPEVITNFDVHAILEMEPGFFKRDVEGQVSLLRRMKELCYIPGLEVNPYTFRECFEFVCGQEGKYGK